MQNSNADIKFYGRRKGKALRTRRALALEGVLPGIAIRLPASLPPLPPAGEGRGEGAAQLNADISFCTTPSPSQPSAGPRPLPQGGRGEEGTWKKERHASSLKARTLRKNFTDAENLFWRKVRDRQINGYKFKRQYSIDKFYADFVCLEKMLVVEIDGGQHNENAKDESRTKTLKSLGYEVIRFWNNDVLENIDGVLSMLASSLSRSAGEGRGEGAAQLNADISFCTTPSPSQPSAGPRPLPQSGRGEIDPSSFFSFTPRQLWLEIGFGDGKHLLHQAMQNPDIGLIGCEPFVNGIASLCADIKDSGVKNIRIWPDDARLFLPALPDNCLDKCFLLNSDPWPKKKHAKRRFVQQQTLDEIHRLLKPGALFRMSSDHPILAAWQLEKTYHHGGFEWTATSAADWRERPSDLPETRYQKKGATQGRPTVFLNFKRT